MSDAPGTLRQGSLRRLREFGIRPNRELGQNFLIDDNILGVVGRAAELQGTDVVLEVGGGLGKFAGQAWRIGLMGHSARDRSVTTLLGALRELLG